MFFSATDPAAIVEWSQAHVKGGNVLLLLGTYRDREAYAGLLAALKGAGIPSFGGLFERVIHATGTYHQGCVATIFRASQSPSLVQGSDQGYRDLARVLPASTPGLDQTLLVFADPEMPSLAAFVQQLYTHYENSVEYLGAETGVKAKHGWAHAGGPMVANQVDAQTIYEINWRPAGDVYRGAVEAVMDDPTSLSKTLRHGVVGFPLGMKRAGAEDLLLLPLEGELSSMKGGYPEMLNKTAVVGAIQS